MMDEDDEMLYREMNEEDDFYMGDREDDRRVIYSGPRDFSHVPVDRPANGSEAAQHGCIALIVAAVLFFMAFLLL